MLEFLMNSSYILYDPKFGCYTQVFNLERSKVLFLFLINIKFFFPFFWQVLEIFQVL